MFSFLLKLRRIDWVLLFSVLSIGLFGLVALYSIGIGKDVPSFTFLQHQGTIFAIGLAVIFLVALIHYRFIQSLTVPLYAIACSLLVAVLFLGQTVRGTKGWFFGFQPVELAKIALILALAYYFSSWRRRIGSLRHVFESAAITLLPLALVLAQPDLGSALILIAIWVAMILMKGIPRKQLLVLVGLFVVVCSFSWMFLLHQYQKERILTFLVPSSDVKGAGYNVRQALIAIGDGQLVGRGIGSGSQSHLKFLPEAQTDFIFSVIAEELGFLGVFFLLLFWIILFYRLKVLLSRAGDDFSAFVIVGCTVLFFTQLVINIGGNLGLIPLTGLVLPFVSYGGSALLVFLVCIGILESICVNRPESMV